MKYLVVLCDGMADEPIGLFNGLTPLQKASCTNMDILAKLGSVGCLQTIPEGYNAGSEVANLSILGYGPEHFENGRAVLEARGMGIKLGNNEIVFRTNLVTIQDGKMLDFTAGEIESEQAEELIEYLQANLGSSEIEFICGDSYRNLCRIKVSDGAKNMVKGIRSFPPHDIIGEPILDYQIVNQNNSENLAKILNELILKSQNLLEKHPLNIKRSKEGKNIANSIWLWSEGTMATIPDFSKLHKINNAAVVAGVDLIRGIGTAAGMEVIKVNGATGSYNTDYEAKVKAAIDALDRVDFVYLHIEATDAAGHLGDPYLKVKVIEDIDKKVLSPILEYISSNKNIRLALLPDHPTPCNLKTHTRNPVPFLIYDPQVEGDTVEIFDEESVKNGSYGLLKTEQFIKIFLND